MSIGKFFNCCCCGCWLLVVVVVVPYVNYQKLVQDSSYSMNGKIEAILPRRFEEDKEATAVEISNQFP